MFVGYSWQRFATNRFAVAQGDTNQFGIGIADRRYPIEATQFLESTGVTGPLFNTFNEGSYLIARGFMVYIDPRAEEHLHRVFGEYDDLRAHPEKFGKLEKAYGFRAALVDAEEVNLVKAIQSTSRWRLCYADDVAAVLLRDDAASSVPELNLVRDADAWSNSRPVFPLESGSYYCLPFYWLSRHNRAGHDAG